MKSNLRRKSFVMFLAFILILFSTLFAVEPPTKEQIERYKRENRYQELAEKAKAFNNHLVAPELVTRYKYNIQKLINQTQGVSEADFQRTYGPPPSWQGMPTKGTVKLLAILIDFSDKKHLSIDTPTSMNTKLFGSGDGGFPEESLRNFYLRSSYDQLKIQGNVLGWYTTSYERREVESSGREKVIKEVLKYYDAAGHDFSQYDNDNNGTIDYFMVIWAGEKGEWGTFWWGYYTGFGDNNFILDGKRLTRYSWQWESTSYPNGKFSPSTVIHETGHALGLPDLYDYDEDDVNNNDGGVGGLDQMDFMGGDHNCFSKFLLEWITPTIINQNLNSITLAASSKSKDALLLMPHKTEHKLFTEYFMVQNRHRMSDGNDFVYPGDGLLIWHIDATLNEAGTTFKYNNSSSEHKYVRLMEADGLEEINLGRAADADDYYINGKEFSASTSPNSNLYNGNSSGVQVYEISNPGQSISFKVNYAGTSTDNPPWFSETTLAGSAVIPEKKYFSGAAQDDIGLKQITMTVSGPRSSLYTAFSVLISGASHSLTPYYFDSANPDYANMNGIYYITLTIKDTKNQLTSKNFTITVTSNDNPPWFENTSLPTAATIPDKKYFSGTAKDDIGLKQITMVVSGPRITNYTAFSNSITGNSHSLNQYYFDSANLYYANMSGNYTVTLTIKDTKEQSRSQSFTITVSSNGPYEPNNTISQAYGPLNKNQWYTAYIESATDIDWYKIVVTGGQMTNMKLVDLSDEIIQKLNQCPVGKEETVFSIKVDSDTLIKTMSNLASNLTVDLDVPDGIDYELFLYDASGNIKGSSTAGTSSDERVTIPVSDGTFYIKIYGYNNAYSTSSAYRVKADWLSTTPKINLTLYDGTSYNYFNPASVSPGGTFTNYLRIRNTENSVSGEFWIYTYLSNDASISTADTKVGELRVSSLNGNTYRDINMGCTVPLSFSGNYYVGMIIDATGMVSETNENDNNWYHGSLLSVGNDTYEPNNTIAQAFGPLNKNQWYTSYIYSATDIDWYKVAVTGGQMTNMTPLDLSDEVLQRLNQIPVDKEDHHISLKAGSDTLSITMSNLASNLTVDLDVPDGKDYELFLYDASGVLKGSSTAGTSSDERITVSVPNGTFYIKIYGYNNAFSTSSAYKVKAFDIPDLPKINLTLYPGPGYNYFNPTSINAGGQFTNYARIQNTESSQAGSFVIYTYISTNSTISVSDTKVGEYTFSSLNGNSFRDISMVCQVPSVTPTGTYYVGVLIDVNGQISESNENDNSWCFNSTLTILPSSGGPYEPNDNMAQAYGPITKGLWYTAYIENSTDIDWYKVNIAGGMFTKTESLDLSPEKLLLLNESSNEKEIFARLLKTRNDSISPIRSQIAVVSFIIDLDVPDGKDYELYVYDYSGLLVGSSTGGTSVDERVTVSVPNGTFYIKIYGYSGEYSTSNSYKLKADWSNPPSGNVNLTLVNGQGYNHFEPKTVTVDGSFSNCLRIQNTESGTSAGFYVNTRISDNDFITEGDPVVGQIYVNSLPGYSYQDVVVVCTLPAGTQPGTYYVAFQIDPTNVIQETNESDNNYKYDASLGLLTVIPKQNILYSENFNDQIADGWVPLIPNRWSIVWDEGDYAYFLNTTSFTGGEQSALTGYAFDNYTLSLFVKSPENLVQNPAANYTIAFNCVPGGYFYAMRFDGINNQNTLFKSGYEIASYNGPTIVDNQYHQIRVTKIGGSIKIYYDNTKVIDYFDYSPIQAGNVTIGSYNDAVYFDDIIITSEQSFNEAILTETSINDISGPKLPDKLALLQNFPNPFNPETRITYALPEQSAVSLIVFDVNGKELRNLFEGNQAPGQYSFLWDAKDENGFTLPSGIYFYQLRIGNRIETKKMLLLK